MISGHTLLLQGYEVTILEKGTNVGGVWKYTDNNSNKVEPMYKSLVTNLPKEVMAYNEEYPFNDNLPSFITHSTVQSYLEEFCMKSNIYKHIKFSSEVMKCTYNNSNNTWSIQYIDHATVDKPISTTINTPTTLTEAYTTQSLCDTSGSVYKKLEVDYLVVCNGHYSKPYTPPITNSHLFTGKQVHSITYDVLTVYTNQRVLVVGSRSSGTDIARELNGVATQVYVSDRNWPPPDPSIPGTDTASSSTVTGSTSGIIHYPGISRFTGGKGVEFVDGRVVHDVDVIIWCTGYLYRYPFLVDYIKSTSSSEHKDMNDCTTTTNTATTTDHDDNSAVLAFQSPSWAEADLGGEGSPAVPGLYHQLIFSRQPSLAFVGLPYAIVPFPLFYIQSLYLAAVWSNGGGTCIPDKECMNSNIYQHESTLYEQYGTVLHRSYHYLGGQLHHDYLLSLINEIQTFTSTNNSDTNKKGHNSDPSVPDYDRLIVYIKMLQEIYLDVQEHRPAYVGGPDDYRKRNYILDRLAVFILCIYNRVLCCCKVVCSIPYIVSYMFTIIYLAHALYLYGRASVCVYEYILYNIFLCLY